MSTPSDLRTDLQRIPVPAVPLDDIMRRGRALKRRKTLATSFGAVASVAVVAIGIAALPSDRVTPDRGPGPAPAASTSDDPELEVFLLDGITARERRNIRSVARDLDGVESVRYISKAAAYRDFKQTYRDEPEYWENLPTDALPAFFVIDLEDGADIQEARDRLIGLRGVDDIRSGRGSDRGSDAYPLVAEDGELRVFAPTNQPYGLCPGPSEALTDEDVPVAEQAVLHAAPEISGGLDTTGANTEGTLAADSSGPPDFATMIAKDCGEEVIQATALVTLHLPEVDSASMGATTYFVSHEERGWVIWGAW
jgi:hypothetical protein